MEINGFSQSLFSTLVFISLGCYAFGSITHPGPFLLAMTPGTLNLGPRQKINAQDCAVFWFVYKAHPSMHIVDMCRWMQRSRRTKGQARLCIYFLPRLLLLFEKKISLPWIATFSLLTTSKCDGSPVLKNPCVRADNLDSFY